MTEKFEEYHSDDDTYSIGADSGYSIGKGIIEEEQEQPNFFSRFASFPIIQSAHQVVQQHTVGQKALCLAESVYSYMPSLSGANKIGNKSLDMIEQQFPIIKKPTDELVEPIKHMVHRWQTSIVDSRIDSIAVQFESLLHLPPSELHGIDRLVNVINQLSTRTSTLLSEKMSATAEEEKQLKQLIHAWIVEQVNIMIQHPQEQYLYRYVESLQSIYQLTQAELEKFRQELLKPDISHMDRIRNLLVLSQTDILIPLYQKTLSTWKNVQHITTYK